MEPKFKIGDRVYCIAIGNDRPGWIDGIDLGETIHGLQYLYTVQYDVSYIPDGWVYSNIHQTTKYDKREWRNRGMHWEKALELINPMERIKRKWNPSSK